MDSYSTLLLSVAVFGASFVGTAAMRLIAPQLGWISQPRKDRWHSKPTALAGGLGCFPAFAAGSAYIFLVNFLQTVRAGRAAIFENRPAFLSVALLTGATMMFFVGLIDDRWNLKPATKLALQLVAASLFIFVGGIFPISQSPLLNAVMTYFWFVGITNAINMLDNMDGLASGVVIIAAATLISLGWRSDPPVPIVVSVGAVLVATMFGFWWHNRCPAAIFMGDSGSLFVGYTLAALAVPSPLNGFFGLNRTGAFVPVLAVLIPITVLAVPIFDTTLVTVTRRLRARPVTEGGRDHSSHRLVGLGLSEKKAVSVLYLLSGFGGAIAVLMRYFSDQSLPLLGFFTLVLIFTGIYLGRTKIQTVEAEDKPPDWTPLVTELLYKRHAAEVLLDAVLISVCFYGAYLLRFEGALPPEARSAFAQSLPLVVASCLVTLAIFGVYRSQWRLISISDLRLYLAGSVVGAALSLAFVTFVTRFGPGHSRTAYLIFGILLFIAISGCRLSFRLLDTAVFAVRGMNLNGRTPVLIYGAGKGGKLLWDEIASNPLMAEYRAIGFVDDDFNVAGRRLCGLRVEQPQTWVAEKLVADLEIWISSPKISTEKAISFSRRLQTWTRIRRVKLELVTLQERFEYRIGEPGAESTLSNPYSDSGSRS
jgi:UDP-GlcNAc:undecaprenyl-phosphate GlcNAc-1-phosphate transferase